MFGIKKSKGVSMTNLMNMMMFVAFSVNVKMSEFGRQENS
jgi:hypothetical protein